MKDTGHFVRLRDHPEISLDIRPLEFCPPDSSSDLPIQVVKTVNLSTGIVITLL